MIDNVKVLEMLIPAGGWVMRGNDFEGIEFIDCTPITKAQFEKGIADYPTYVAAKKAEEDAEKAQEALDRASGEAKLLAVGLTKAEIKAIRKDQ